MFQEFPKMLYHVVEPPKVVNTSEEEREYLEKGWSTNPVVFSELAAADAKIAETKTALKALEATRRKLLKARAEE
jgi:hypothetical protein